MLLYVSLSFGFPASRGRTLASSRAGTGGAHESTGLSDFLLALQVSILTESAASSHWFPLLLFVPPVPLQMRSLPASGGS